jgi:hypothetical protein
MASDAEAAWRARMLDELVRNKRLSPEEAQVFIEHQSHYRPWELCDGEISHAEEFGPLSSLGAAA